MNVGPTSGLLSPEGHAVHISSNFFAAMARMGTGQSARIIDIPSSECTEEIMAAVHDSFGSGRVFQPDYKFTEDEIVNTTENQRWLWYNLIYKFDRSVFEVVYCWLCAITTPRDDAKLEAKPIAAVVSPSVEVSVKQHDTPKTHASSLRPRSMWDTIWDDSPSRKGTAAAAGKVDVHE